VQLKWLLVKVVEFQPANLVSGPAVIRISIGYNHQSMASLAAGIRKVKHYTVAHLES